MSARSHLLPPTIPTSFHRTKTSSFRPERTRLFFRAVSALGRVAEESLFGLRVLPLIPIPPVAAVSRPVSPEFRRACPEFRRGPHPGFSLVGAQDPCAPCPHDHRVSSLLL